MDCYYLTVKTRSLPWSAHLGTENVLNKCIGVTAHNHITGWLIQLHQQKNDNTTGLFLAGSLQLFTIPPQVNISDP
jgi:hypothetical protein